MTGYEALSVHYGLDKGGLSLCLQRGDLNLEAQPSSDPRWLMGLQPATLCLEFRSVSDFWIVQADRKFHEIGLGVLRLAQSNQLFTSKNCASECQEIVTFNRERPMEFLLQLARLRGTDTLQNCVSPPDEKVQFLRFLAGSTESLARCIGHAAASRSFYRSNCSKQWLLTVLTSHDTALKSESDLNIQSNVVPSRAYLTRLEGGRVTCHGLQCTGGFVPTSDIGPALEGQLPHQSCKNCALAEQLRIRLEDRIADDQLANLLKLWFLEAREIEPVRDIMGGADGDVSIILWRDGTFARKRFHCDDDLLRNPKFLNPRFNRELEVALRVSHPNIVHCFGCSTDCDLFMEVLDEDLESFLTRSEEMDPPFSLRDALEMLLQVAEAVKHLHENSFIHGDLKPGNILLSKLAMPHPHVPFYLVKVADFGCAQRFHSAGTTRENFDFKIGTHEYLAPEVKRCRKLRMKEDLREAVQNIDPPKVDVFSFGVLANEVVANVHESNSLSSLQKFLFRCEAQEPEERPYFTEICATLSGSINHGLRKKEGICKGVDRIDDGTHIIKTMKRMWHGEETY